MSRYGRAGSELGGPFDTVIVGSGPGGATVAAELAGRGLRVAILEMGEAAPVTGGAVQTIRELWRPGRSLFLTTGLLAVLRGVTVGGSSIYFWGTAWDPPDELFRRHGVDISAEVEQTKRELGVAPLPVELFGPAARRIMEAATGLGYDWKPLPKFLDPALIGGPVMGSYGAPSYAAKWNARKAVDDAVAAGAMLLTGAQVRRVLRSDGVAAGVEFVRHGKAQTVLAPTVVVAAGGIGSPVILRASGITDAGTSFFCDPLVAVTGALPGPRHGVELPMVGGALFAGDGYMLTDMSVPAWVHAVMHAQVGRFDRVPGHGHTAAIMVKVRDDVQGSITPRGGIRKRLTAGDRDKLDHGAERAARILRAAGARRLARTLPFAAHPGGTVPLGRLVDRDLRTELPGLYVCDASVISDPWGLPPTLTLIGLGKRLARHLADTHGVTGQTDGSRSAGVPGEAAGALVPEAS